MTSETLRDHFAAAALTGLLAQGDDGSFSEESYARAAYRWADAMLRCLATADCPLPDNAPSHDAAPAARASEATASPERVRVRGDAGTGDTDHGGSPEAIASVGRPRTDKADSRPGEGTGDTPATHATRGEGSEQRECTEPVAWAVMPSNSDYCVTLSTRKEAAKKAAEMKVEVGEYASMDDIVIVPLYRHPQPTLTDAERSLLEMLADHPVTHEIMPNEVATLWGLLERLGGAK